MDALAYFIGYAAIYFVGAIWTLMLIAATASAFGALIETIRRKRA